MKNFITALILTIGLLFAVASAHTLGFAVYTNTPALLPQFKGYYSNATANDLLIDDTWNPTPLPYIAYYGTPQAFPRMILANNYTSLVNQMTPLAASFGSKDYLGFDMEDWALTPLSEQNSQGPATQQACSYVHSLGYKFAFTPEIDVPGWFHPAAINWSCIDFLDLQEQFLTGSPAALIKNVSQQIASTNNPKMAIFVQLDMAQANQSTLESEVSSLALIQGVSGVMLQDYCTTASCTSTLTNLVNYIKNVGESPIVASSTTSSTSTTIDTFNPPSSCSMLNGYLQECLMNGTEWINVGSLTNIASIRVYVNGITTSSTTSTTSASTTTIPSQPVNVSFGTDWQPEGTGLWMTGTPNGQMTVYYSFTNTTFTPIWNYTLNATGYASGTRLLGYWFGIYEVVYLKAQDQATGRWSNTVAIWWI